jgi:tRNA(fMet)-specific endonuclease VapC
MAWFLDTNIIVFCLRGKSPAAMQRIHSTPANEVSIPMQVFAELLVGAEKSAKPETAIAKTRAFIAPFAITWPDASVVDHYTSIRVALENQGNLISEADLWIAATVREFRRVPGLKVEDWTLP